MSEIVLFHHAQGLTPGVLALAQTWRDAGHTVHTPDVYDGQTFDTLEPGLAYAEQVGFDALLEAAVRQAPDATRLVVVGLSLGVMPAQLLAQTSDDVAGAVLVGSCVPPEAFGTWPTGLPAQVHGMADDPVSAGEGDLDAARDLAADQPSVEVFVYPGSTHLFVDSSLADFDPAAAALFGERALAFLDRVG